MHVIKIIPLNNFPIIKKDDDLGAFICEAAERQDTPLQKGDILVVTHVIVSRAEGNVIDLIEVVPSEFARTIAREFNRDPSLIEVVLRESKSIIRIGDGHLISKTKHGFICANAGVDRSNIPGSKNVSPLPKNPDNSALEIRQRIKEISGKEVKVLISDTHGRALRKGEINITIGIAGMKPIRDHRDKIDLFGYKLKVKQTAIADELCSAAELVMGQSNEGVPVAIIRGYLCQESEDTSAKELLWPEEKSLFF